VTPRTMEYQEKLLRASWELDMAHLERKHGPPQLLCPTRARLIGDYLSHADLEHIHECTMCQQTITAERFTEIRKKIYRIRAGASPQNCPYCESSNRHLVRRPSISEWLLSFLGCATYRCERCQNRYHSSRGPLAWCSRMIDAMMAKETKAGLLNQ
jgi:hypothetical protein